MKQFGWLLCLALTPAALAQNPVEYGISFSHRDHHEAEVTVQFSAVATPRLDLHMSRSSPGRYALHEFAKNVYRVKAQDRQGRPLPITRPNAHQWIVSGHDGTVHVTYTIFGDRSDGTYLAVDHDHAHINMPATFMWAEGMEDRPILITFHKPKSDWKIATQLVPTENEETYRSPNLYYFMDSPTEISNSRWREWRVGPTEHPYTMRLAIHHQGTEEETDAYANLAKTVVREAVAVYGELPHFDYSTYTFIADYLPYVNGDGMEHRNSTIISSKRSLKKNAVANLGTLSHEFFHSWNVERMRPRSLEPFDFDRANMSGELWFAEGFTSYYGNLILKRARLISLDRYASGLSPTLNTVLNGPGRRLFSVVEMSRQAPFVDAGVSIDPKNLRNTFISYYPYGATIGLGLDLTLRRRFTDLTLDDFMRAAWKQYGKTERPYTNADLERVLGEVTGDTGFAKEFFRTYIYGHEVLDYGQLLAQAGLSLRKKNKDKAWMGSATLRYADDKATIRSSTLVGSPLYEAGLDRNDVILKIDDTTLGSQEDLNNLLKEYKPGDRVSILYRTNGEEEEAQLTFQQDPQLEVVPFEHISKPITRQIQSFREEWIGSKSGLNGEESERYCPKCRRSYPFRYEYCRYDGSRLNITPAHKQHKD